MKTCNLCGEAKPLPDFYKHKRSKDGHQSCCKLCSKEAVAKWQRENRQALRDRQTKWRRKNPDAYGKWQRANRDHLAAREARRRARKFGAGHEPYKRADIFAAYNNECAYCGAPAEHLDHVVPISKGGADAAHNLLPACAPCNLSKAALSLAEWALSWSTN